MNVSQKILLIFVLIIIFILPLFIIFDEKGLMDLYLLKQKRNHFIQINAKLARENIRLQRLITRLNQNDPDLIGRLARDELGMIGKDEFVLIPSRSMNNQ